MTEVQRKVTKFIFKINYRMEIIRYSQFEWYSKQGNMIKFEEE